MADTLFQWPGGKSGQFDRIMKLMPDHECFVEGFGGSGVITLNKPKSVVDVYNDLDSELVHFFVVYREAPEQLCNWLESVPYSYSTYEDFVDAFYGEANEDRDEQRLPGRTITDNLATADDISYNDVRRAGIFFTLRYTQFGAKYQGRSGFGRSKVQNGAETFNNAKERLREFVGCWDHVTIENVSYEKLIDTYDSEETFYYFDPPYIGTEEYYLESNFNHAKFVENLERIEGYWIVSYDKIPKKLEKYHITREKSTNFIDSGMKGEGKETVETLIMNFQPDNTQGFTSSGQSSISEVVGNGEQSEDEEDGEKLFESTDTNGDDETAADDWLGTEEEEDDDEEGWLADEI